MIIQDTTGVKVAEKVRCQCDRCGSTFLRRLKGVKKARSLRGCDKDYCMSCANVITLASKPQCRSEFWTPERKILHSESIKDSDDYYESIAKRDQHGIRNGMYGKKHTAETRRKMSIVRTGKTGRNATAWKGGKQSVIKRLKGRLQKITNWFGRVIKRDGQCCDCCATDKLDAHHVESIASLVRRLSIGKKFTSNDEKLEWLFVQPEILDNELKNGITLCRSCHKKKHTRWGSHIAP